MYIRDSKTLSEDSKVLTDILRVAVSKSLRMSELTDHNFTVFVFPDDFTDESVESAVDKFTNFLY